MEKSNKKVLISRSRIYIIREAIMGLKEHYDMPHDEFVTLVDNVIGTFLSKSLDIIERDFIELQDENDYLKKKLHS